jgi:hypothetical protein
VIPMFVVAAFEYMISIDEEGLKPSDKNA